MFSYILVEISFCRPPTTSLNSVHEHSTHVPNNTSTPPKHVFFIVWSPFHESKSLLHMLHRAWYAFRWVECWKLSPPRYVFDMLKLFLFIDVLVYRLVDLQQPPPNSLHASTHRSKHVPNTSQKCPKRSLTQVFVWANYVVHNQTSFWYTVGGMNTCRCK